jgi:uncharacterized membrane protein YgcG
MTKRTRLTPKPRGRAVVGASLAIALVGPACDDEEDDNADTGTATDVAPMADPSETATTDVAPMPNPTDTATTEIPPMDDPTETTTGGTGGTSGSSGGSSGGSTGGSTGGTGSDDGGTTEIAPMPPPTTGE